ncbi:sporulation-induced protein [Coemansia erecta]|uniref:Sporulation-induced protein n=1 Tax=Coemansia erecta TaxID=147472 RepID=A0A9W7XTK4_9FUNG|nr:sporulation-induced protein [Coemansia erecta]
MLWRFGLQHASNIDKLLDKDDLALEEVLNDSDFLQEVRDQNPKLVSYLTRPQNLKQMVDYIATEEFFKFSKMASISCDVLCSNSISFVETLIAAYSLRDFADSDDEDEGEDDELDSDSDVSDDNNDGASRRVSTPTKHETTDNQTSETAADNNESPLSPQRSSQSDSPGTSLSQQPTRPFVASSPFSPSSRAASTTALASPRQHLLESLWGVMQLSGGQLDALQATYFSRVMCSLLQRKPYETLDFIRSQGNVVSRFLEHLSVSAVVDLLLKIISLEELEGGPGIIAWLSEDRLIPMLVDRLSPDCDPEMHSLAAQVLLDIIAISQCNNPTQPTIGTNALIEELKSQETVTRLADYMLDRTAPHATSTLVNCVYIFIELIRRNYSEGDADMTPEDQANGYGFGGSYDGSSYDQQGPRKLPTVDLSDMMRVLALRTRDMVELLRSPRSSTEPVPTTLGLREPLGFERLRICELFAELLHCSNMPRLNVSVEQAAGEALAGAAASAASGDVSRSSEDLPTHKDSPTVVGFTPRHQGSPGHSSESSPHNLQQAFSPGSARSTASSGSNSSANLRQAAQQGSAGADSEASDGSGYSGIPLEIGSPSEHDTSNTPVGQLLKWNFIQHSVLPICTDLFFQFSLNNFLHSVVYDIMHQVLNLPLNLECNLALIVVAFRDVRITSRIAQACAQNDQVSREPRGTRLGYMGHLTGIGEEVARLLELSGAALEPLIAPYIDGDEWLDYVARTLQEVRERDQQPLGGERPGGGQGGNDMMSGDNAAQVFVSRMGLVDPSSNESYGAEEDDDDDIDEDMDDEEDDDMDEDDDDEVGRFTRRAQGKGFGRPPKQQKQQQSAGMLYPNNEEDETSAEYMATHQNMYFGRSQFDMVDDSDQFIIKDDDEDDDVGLSAEHGDDGGDGIGPAGRIGRFRSYQNEQAVGGYSQGDDDDDDDIVVSSAPKTVQGSAMDEDSSDGGSGSVKAGKDSGDVDEDDEDGEDSDGASEVGRMRDYMRNRAADIAEATRQKSLSPPSPAGAKQQPAAAADLDGSRKERRQLVRLSFDGSAHTVATVDHLDNASLPSYLLALPKAASSSSTCSFPSAGEPSSSCTFTFSSPVGAAAASDSALVSLPTPPQSKVAGTSFPSVNGVDDDASATSANTAVAVNGSSQKIPLPPVPKVPPHPFASLLASMPPPPPIPTHPFAPQSQQQQPPPVPKNRPKNPFVEPKGRVMDLYRESKQRSHSSSELDSIVPADIGSWTADGASSSSTAALSSLSSGSKPDQPPADDPDLDGSSARRGRTGSFAARRQRSRSQSAGVGITREMVIQAASQGQFPYLDAKTCEFVGQLKSDTVTLGGAAAGGGTSSSRQRSKTAAGSAAAGIAIRGLAIPGQSGSAPSSAASSPVVKPAIHMREGSSLSGSPQQTSGSGLRSSGLAQSSLRSFPSETQSDSSGDSRSSSRGSAGGSDDDNAADGLDAVVAGFGSMSLGGDRDGDGDGRGNGNGNDDDSSLNHSSSSPPSSSSSMPAPLLSTKAGAGPPLAKQQHHHSTMKTTSSKSSSKHSASFSSSSSTVGAPNLPSALTIPTNRGAGIGQETRGNGSSINGSGADDGRGWRRGRGGDKRASAASKVKGMAMMPNFPVLPMSPVHKSTPIMLDSLGSASSTSTSPE